MADHSLPTASSAGTTLQILRWPKIVVEMRPQIRYSRPHAPRSSREHAEGSASSLTSQSFASLGTRHRRYRCAHPSRHSELLNFATPARNLRVQSRKIRLAQSGPNRAHALFCRFSAAPAGPQRMNFALKNRVHCCVSKFVPSSSQPTMPRRPTPPQSPQFRAAPLRPVRRFR
jgi:hypothetical protein